MKLFLRILSYLKKVWPNVILGLFVLVIYASFSGVSLGIVYPVVDEIFVKQTEEEWKADEANRSSANLSYIFKEAEWLVGRSVQAVRHNWKEEGRLDKIKDEINVSLKEFSERNSKSMILKLLLVLAVILFFIRSLSMYFQQIIFKQIEEKVIMFIRNDFYEAILKKPIEFFHSHKLGEVISRAVNDVNMIRGMTLNSVTNLIRNLLLVTVYVFMMVAVSERMSMMMLFVVIPISVTVSFISSILKRRSRKVQQKFADITSILQETIMNIRIVFSFAMGNYERARFLKENKKFYKKSVHMIRAGQLVTPFTEFVSVMITLVIIWYGGLLVLNPQNAMTAGKFSLFLVALLASLHPIKEIAKVYSEINKGLAAAERVFEVIDEPVNLKDKDDAKSITAFTDSIVFNDMSFKYPTSDIVLRDINLTIKKGEAVAFVGPSGGGKSTMMDLLLRFYDPVKGSIRIDNVDMRDYKTDDVRNLMGMVTQEVILFDDTVSHNISYGRLDASKEDIIQAAKAANAHDFILELEEGYETIIGERGAKLSGGQKQRLAIARAILKNPQILIFDEATSSLDGESEYQVQEAIYRLMKDRTTLIIAHRLSTIRNCNKIIVIDKGIIVEQGSHEELIEQGNLYKKLYNIQFRDFTDDNSN
ncbi:MAG: ABC transporter ATP-binding protein [Candidatus Cloacimonetes bacterium]|nr:ABC transporter ATP-binding protein [Candidatus Cloacimonadota bacterium]